MSQVTICDVCGNQLDASEHAFDVSRHGDEWHEYADVCEMCFPMDIVDSLHRDTYGDPLSHD